MKEERSTLDLIEELEAEAPKFTSVMLAVELDEHKAAFIFANDPERLSKLDNAMRAGGNPLGFIGLGWEEGGRFRQILSTAVKEHEGDVPGCSRGTRQRITSGTRAAIIGLAVRLFNTVSV
jgi:hypothetical protein